LPKKKKKKTSGHKWRCSLENNYMGILFCLFVVVVVVVVVVDSVLDGARVKQITHRHSQTNGF
jgi:t-SNARE complex subunit (syntaxin)